jgi:hypothetical protein
VTVVIVRRNAGFVIAGVENGFIMGQFRRRLHRQRPIKSSRNVDSYRSRFKEKEIVKTRVGTA